MMGDQETRILPKGTMVKIGGIPLVLDADSPLTTHKANWPIALEPESEKKDSSK